MMKGYTLEVMNKDVNRHSKTYGQYCGSTCFHYGTEEEAHRDMKNLFHDRFCILTEWMQDGGFGDYEIEIARQN